MRGSSFFHLTNIYHKYINIVNIYFLDWVYPFHLPEEIFGQKEL